VGPACWQPQCSRCGVSFYSALLSNRTHRVSPVNKAKIIVTGYFPIVSDQSNTTLLTLLLIAMGVPLAGIPGAILGGILSPFAKNAIVSNSSTFASESTTQLGLAVNEVNADLGGLTRIFLAVPRFRPENAALAPDPWLYGISVGPGGATAQDPVAVSRAVECTSAAAARPPGDVDIATCKVASLGHPNPKGGRAYLDAVQPFL
jgi:hypothetical protein